MKNEQQSSAYPGLDNGNQFGQTAYQSANDANFSSGSTGGMQSYDSGSNTGSGSKAQFNLPTDVQQRLNQYNQKYDNTSPIWSGLKAMGMDDWQGVGKTALQGFERVADGASLGLYSLANKNLGGNYQERKDQYHREAEQAGIGGLAKANDDALDFASSSLGAGRFMPKITPSNMVGQATSTLMNDVVGSGVTAINRSGDWNNAEDKFSDGMMDSPYVRMMKYWGGRY